MGWDGMGERRERERERRERERERVKKYELNIYKRKEETEGGLWLLKI